jgi:hypothetical protein
VPVNRHGAGGAEELTAPVQAGKPLLVAVSRKPLAGKDAKGPSLQAEDEPYELTTLFQPGP